MVKLANFNLKIKDNILFYSLYVGDKKVECYGEQGWLNNKVIFQFEKVSNKIIFLDLSEKGFYNETSYPWVKKRWNIYWVKISPVHLELLKQWMVKEEQEKLKEKELKKEQTKEDRKRIVKHNRKAEWVIINIKDEKRLNTTYNFNGKKYSIENNLGEIAVRNKKTDEVIAWKEAINDYLMVDSDTPIWVKLHNRILAEWKKEGVINRTAGSKDFGRLLNNSEIRSKDLEINV